MEFEDVKGYLYLRTDSSRILFLRQQFIKQKGYPDWTQVTRVVEGAETPIFKQFFKEWPEADGQKGIGQVKRGNIGNYPNLFSFALDKQQ